MKDYRVLQFLDLFKGLFLRFEIDYKSMRKILQTKLLLDSRRISTIMENNNRSEDDEEKNNFIRSLGIYLIFGLIMIPFLLLGDDYLFQMSFVFGMFMFFMITALIADFSSVLLDLRDKEILLSKPVNNRTINMAKLLHIFFYVFMITMAIIGPSLVASLVKRGFLFFLIYFLEIIFIDLFLIVLTGLIYLVILRFFDGEKLKDIINYVQIALTIGISLGYQLIGRVFNIIDLNTIEFSGKWWSYIISPLWFAAPFELILNNNREKHILIYSLMAVVIPVLSIIIYIKLMPTFERNLQKLNNVEGKKKRRSNQSNFISKLICRTKEEETFYRFSTNMIKNERVFKLKVYPNLGFGFAFPFIMLLSFVMGGSFAEIRSSNMYFNMYFTTFSLLTILQYLSYSGNYKGAWIYKVLPVKDMESIYKGTVKASLINLFTPMFIVVSIIFLFIFGLKIIPHIIVIYLNMMLLTSIIFKLTNKNKDLPFSRSFEISQEGMLGDLFLFLLVTGLLFGIHFLFEKVSYGVYIYLVIAIMLNSITWRYFFKPEEL